MKVSSFARYFALGVLSLVVVVFAFSIPHLAVAGPLDGPIVPTCDAADQPGVGFSGACQLCDLVHLADNMVRFVVAFSVIVATLLFAYAGMLYVTAASKPDNIKKAHEVFIKVFVGLVIILVAWLVVDIIMRTLAGAQFALPWRDIPCAAYPNNGGQNLVGAPSLQGGGRGTGTDTGSGGGSGLCGAVGAGCGVTQATQDKITAMNAALGSPMTVTAGVGPPGRHYAECQNPGNPASGTCVDAVWGNMSDPRSIRTFIDAANAQGMRAVLEVCAGGDAAIGTRASSQGVSLADSEVIDQTCGPGGHISGPHYSVYTR